MLTASAVMMEIILPALYLIPYSRDRRGIAVVLPKIYDVKNASTRVAELLGVPLGGNVVGCKYRGEDELYREVTYPTSLKY